MNKLKIVVELARGSGYNEQNKAAYKRLAMSVLRIIAKQLQLPKESYSIRFNAGGVAVSGEATLHHDNFYLQTSSTGIMFRRCDGQKDYGSSKMSGEYANQWAIMPGHWLVKEMTVDQLVARLHSLVVPNAQVE